jgi:CxC1 like cysteine cluster associated with KDZ transposases
MTFFLQRFNIHGRSRRDDYRTRHLREQCMHASWDAQITDLVNAYLNWRYRPVPDLGSPLNNNQRFFEVTAIDIKGNYIFLSLPYFSLSQITDRVHFCKITYQCNEHANVTLIWAGFLGCSPVNPSVAISLECLELYHQIRRRQSSFILQAMAKVLCVLHNVSHYKLAIFKYRIVETSLGNILSNLSNPVIDCL